MKEGISINKLLIVGAGGHGRCCLEIANSMNEFEKISFLDDQNISKLFNDFRVIGKINEMEKFYPEYNKIFIAVGNNKIRERLMLKAKKIGYSIVTLIASSCYISASAIICEGTVVFPHAVINANVYIDTGCIISSNTVIDYDAKVEQYCHINTLAVVPSMASVKAYTKVDYGQVYINKEENEDWKKEYEKQFGSEPSFF